MIRFCAFGVVLLLLLPATAKAQSATEKLEQGIEAYKRLDSERAIPLLNDALQLGLSKADQVRAYETLAFCYTLINQPTQAKQAFESLLNIDPAYELDPDTTPKFLVPFQEVKGAIGQKLLQAGIAAYETKSYTNAIDHLEKALKAGFLDEDSRLKAYEYLGFCYIEAKQPEQAEIAFDKLLAIRQDHELGNISQKYRKVFDKVREERVARVILIRSVPSGATVYLDGKAQSKKTDTQLEGVDANRHTLKISLEGYKDWTDELSEQSWERASEVGGKLTLEVTATLVRLPPPPPGGPKKEGGRGILYAIGGAVVGVGAIIGALVFGGGGGDDGGDDGDGTGGSGGDDIGGEGWPKSPIPSPPTTPQK